MPIVLTKNSVVTLIPKGIVAAATPTGWAVSGGTSDGKPWSPPAGIEAYEAPDEVTFNWIRQPDGSWLSPGISVSESLNLVDEHTAKLLQEGTVVNGVRFTLDTSDRLDWLGLYVMQSTLLGSIFAQGGTIPVVGLDGTLNLASFAEVSSVAEQLSTYRLYLQSVSAYIRGTVLANADSWSDQQRLAFVQQYLWSP